jgi:tetratricopeptide (TPR) repeat protein
MRAQLLHAVGKYAEAVDAFSKVIDDEGVKSQALMGRATSLAARGDKASIALAIRDLSAIPVAQMGTDECAKCAFVKATLRKRLGDLVGAETAFTESLAAQHSSQQANKEGKERTIHVVDQPSYSLTLLHRAAVRAELKEFEDAISDYNEVISREPNNVEAISGRGFTYFAIGDLERAKEDCEDAIRLDPRDRVALSVRAEIRRKIGNIAGAIEDWETLSEPHYEDSVRINALISLARMFIKNARTADAKEAMERASAINASDLRIGRLKDELMDKDGPETVK